MWRATGADGAGFKNPQFWTILVGAHEGNKGHGSKGQDVVPAIPLDHAAKLGSTNLQIIMAVSLR